MIYANYGAPVRDYFLRALTHARAATWSSTARASASAPR
jgi:hypothetical protein